MDIGVELNKACNGIGIFNHRILDFHGKSTHQVGNGNQTIFLCSTFLHMNFDAGTLLITGNNNTGTVVTTVCNYRTSGYELVEL